MQQKKTGSIRNSHPGRILWPAEELKWKEMRFGKGVVEGSAGRRFIRRKVYGVSMAFAWVWKDVLRWLCWQLKRFFLCISAWCDFLKVYSSGFQSFNEYERQRISSDRFWIGLYSVIFGSAYSCYLIAVSNPLPLHRCSDVLEKLCYTTKFDKLLCYTTSNILYRIFIQSESSRKWL